MDYKNQDENIIAGRNPVLEALKAGTKLDVIYISKGEKNGSINKIIAIAKKQNIVIKEAADIKLEHMSNMTSHQGVVATMCCAEYSTVEEILELSKQKNEQPFIIIADEIEDPHNLGAIIRTAECAGAHGVIIPKRRSASLNSVVYKTSCGAVNYLKIARVTNLKATIDELKKQNIWIYAAEPGKENYRQFDYSGGAALVVGSEGNGISRLIKENCDFLVSIPVNGKITSLNAAVAAGILMYEIASKRSK